MSDYIDLTPKCKCGFAYNLPDATACKQCGAPYPPKGSKAARARAMARGELPADGQPARPSTAPVRRHVLTAAGAEHTLAPGKVFSMGRGEGCALTIPSKRVSRQHAEIFWRSGRPVIKNVSATNQTKVNDRPIKEHELRDGDTVQVGPYEMTYRALRPGESSTGAVAEDQMTLVSESEALAGNLNQFSLFELLATFEKQSKTGTISISTDEEDGQIVLDQGKFVKATFENQTGEDAVLSMLALEDGLFQITKEAKAAPMKIMRTFDYNASGPAGGGKRDLKRISISQMLDRARKLQARSAAPAPRRPAGRGPRRGPPRRGPGRPLRRGRPRR